MMGTSLARRQEETTSTQVAGRGTASEKSKRGNQDNGRYEESPSDYDNRLNPKLVVKRQSTRAPRGKIWLHRRFVLSEPAT